MTYLKQSPEAIKITHNKVHPIKSDRPSELEALITYLVNYLKPKILTDLQEKVLIGAWEGKTYLEISEETYNDPDYLKGVGASLWKILSEALSEEVTKRNIKLVTKRDYKRLIDINKNFEQGIINIPKVTNLTPNLEVFSNKVVTNKYRDWGEAVDVSNFYGRSQELITLEKWITKDRCRLIALLGMGGIGKTSLAAKLARQVEAEFEVVIWKSLRNAPEFKNILTELIDAVCDRQTLYLADTIDGQINNLIKCLSRKRCLLIFDGLDNILASGKLGGQYRDHDQGYGHLLRRIQDEQHQSCVLITSREKPTGLSIREGKKSVVRSHVVKGLSNNAALDILDDRSLIGSESTLKRLINRCEGNPLILKMISSTIETLFKGDVQIFLNCNHILYGNIWQLIDQQFQRLSNLEKRIINYLVLENSSITVPQLSNNNKFDLPSGKIIEALESLERRFLIEITETGVFLPSLLLEYLKKSYLNKN